MGSLEPFAGQAVDEMVAGRVENVGAQRARHGKRKMNLNGFHYGRVFHGVDVVECPVLKEVKLTAGERLRRRAVSDRVRRIDAEQQAASARIQGNVKYYKGQPASRSTAVSFEGNRSDKRDRAGSSGSENGRGRF